MRLRHAKIAFSNAGHISGGNDISKIVANLSSSTNNVLIGGLFRRGFGEIFQFSLSHVRFDASGAPVAEVVRLRLRDKTDGTERTPSARPLTYGSVACSYSGSLTMNVNDFDVIFVRGDDLDPDLNVLALHERTRHPLYINSIQATLTTQDKFQIKSRAESLGIKIPPTRNAQDIRELLAALRDLPGKYKVVKARYGYGGRLVWKVSADTRKGELTNIFHQCKGGALVQEYKSIVEKGDLRVCLFDGSILGDGAILRRAAPGTWKTNIDLGGSQERYYLDEKMKIIAKRIGEAYREVRLQGIDMLRDGTFLETNAYPSTVGYLERHFGISAEDIILDKVLSEIASR